MLQPNKDKSKILYDAVSKDYDIGTFEEFKQKLQDPNKRKAFYDGVGSEYQLGTYDEFQNKIGLLEKKKDISSSTSASTKSASVQENGSSGGQKPKKSFRLANDQDYENERNNQMSPKGKKNGDITYIVPKINKKEAEKIKKAHSDIYNIDEKGFQKESSLEQLNTLDDNLKLNTPQKKQLLKTTLNNYNQATTVSKEDINSFVQEANDMEQGKDIWENFKSGLANTWNFVANEINMTSLRMGTGVHDIYKDTDVFSNEKKEAKKRLLDQGVEKNKITSQLLNETAKKIYVENKIKDKKISLANDFLENVSDEEKEVLNINFTYDKGKLSDKENMLINNMKIAESKIKDIKNDIEPILNKQKNNQPLTSEEIEIIKQKVPYLQEHKERFENDHAEFQSNRKNLLSVNEEFDLVKRNYGGFENTVADLTDGVGSILLGLAQTMVSGTNTPIGSKIEIQRFIANKQTELNKWNEDNFKKQTSDIHNVNDFMNWSADVIAKQLPNLAVMYATGGGSALASRLGVTGSKLALGAIGAYSYGNKKNELIDSNTKGKTTYSNSEIEIASILYGASEMIETSTLKQLSNFSRVIEAGLADTATRELFRKNIKEQVIKGVKNYTENVGKEVLEEEATNLVQNWTEINVLKNKEKGLFDNASEVLKTSALMSSFLQMPHIAGAIAKKFNTNQYNDILDKNSVEIQKLYQELEKENLSNDAIKVISEKISLLSKQSDNIVKGVFSKIENMPNEAIDKIVELEKTTSEIRAKANAINNDSNINKETKENLLKDLKEEYKKSEELRVKIVSGKSTILDVIPEEQVAELKKQAVQELISEKKGTHEANYTDYVVSEKALEIYNKNKENEIQNKNTVTENQQEAQPQTEEQKTEQEVLEKPVQEKSNNIDQKITNSNQITEPNKANALQEDIENIPVNNIDIFETSSGNFNVREKNEDGSLKQVLGRFKTKEEAQNYLNSINNEGQTQGNIDVNEDVRLGNNEMVSNESQRQNSTSEDIQPTTNDRTITTRKVTVPGFANKPTEYEYDIDEKNNEVVEIRKNNGQVISKFVEREVKQRDKKTKEVRVVKKLVPNANYNKIEASILGISTKNKTDQETKKKINEAIDNFEPSNEHEIALLFFASGGTVSLDSIQYETGNKDNKWAFGQFNKKKPKSIETVAEDLAEEFSNTETNRLEPQDIRNALIDVITSFSNNDEVKNEILNIFTLQNNPSQEEIDFYYSRLSEKDRALIDNVLEEEEYLSELTDAQIQEYYNSKIEEYEQGKRAATEQQARETNEPISEITSNNNDEKRGSNSEEKTGEKVIFYSWIDINNETPMKGEILPNGDVVAEDGTIYTKESVEIEGNNDNVSKLEGLSNWLDALDNKLKNFGNENLGINIPIVVARGAIKAMKAAISTAQTVQDVIQAGLDFVKQSDWYNNLSNQEQNDVDNNFEDLINKPFQGTEQKKSRFKIEEEVQKRLNNGESETDIINSLNDRRENMIAKDYLARQKGVTKEQARQIVDDSFNKSDSQLNDNRTKEEKINNWFRSFISKFFDRQFTSKFILNKAGGKIVRNYLIASKGATGYAKQMYDNAYKKIYKGLTSKEIKTLDKIIQLRRFIAIDENRAKNNLPNVVHPDFINKQIAETYLDDLRNNIGDEKYNDLIQRANNYFDEFRNLLSEMQKSGLISEDSLNKFFEIDYQPRMFLEFLQDNENNFEVETSNNSSLSKEQIQTLEDGLDSSLINDSQYLLSRAMNMRTKSIAMNNTNKKFVEFIEKQAIEVEALRNKQNKTEKEKNTIKYFDELLKKVKINPIIGFTETGNPNYKYNLPKGFKNTYYYIDGVKQNIMMEESFYNSYFDSTKGFLNGNAKEVATTLSGTAIVKTMATGNNPTFFITNTPRDFIFISTFSDEYSVSVLKNMAMLTKDVIKGIKDIRKETDTFQNFIKYGGMMDFLKDQGVINQSGVLQSLFNKFDNKTKEKSSAIFNVLTLSKLQVYSEVGFRMAVFNRSIKNQLKENGYSKIEDVTSREVLDDIYINAVASARSIMDFNQGGTITKDLDSFIPYLNAATQGTRVMFDNFRERPLETTWKSAQTASILSASAIGLSYALISLFKDDEDERDLGEVYLDAKKGVSKYDQTNYFIIFTGEKTDDGQYKYIRIAKPQQLTPFLSLTDGLFTDVIKRKNGDSSPSNTIDNISFAFEKNISPLEFSLTGNIARNPLLKASLTYSTGYDFFRNEDLSYLKGKVPVEVEGFESKNVEDFYKKIGKESGMSPVRFKAAVESFITTPSTSPYVGFLYGGLDAIASDKEGKEVVKKLGKDLLKSTLNRVTKETTDFNRRLSNNEELKKKITEKEIENVENKNLFRKYADALINKEMSSKEVTEELLKISKDNPYEAKRLHKMLVDRIKNKNISPYVFEIKYASSHEAKALMLVDLFGSDLANSKNLSKEEKNLIKQMYKVKAINNEDLFEYMKLIKQPK